MISPQVLSLYLSNGAVDVVGTVGAVLLIVQVTKPLFDLWINPSKPVHDTVIQLWAGLLSLVAVYCLTWAGPGFPSRIDYVTPFFQTIAATAAAFGIYAKIRGDVPQTPTTAHIARMKERLAAAEATVATTREPTIEPATPAAVAAEPATH